MNKKAFELSPEAVYYSDAWRWLVVAGHSTREEWNSTSKGRMGKMGRLGKALF